MEFISGIRLDEWLGKNAPTIPQTAVSLISAIAETIALCHEKELGHRDIKPANIILKNSDIQSPYILDFGISFDSRQTYVLTREGEMFWNEFLILPECQDGIGGHRDLRSDITALAGLFFHCLTGSAPHVLLDAQGRAPQVRHEELVIKAAVRPEQAERLIRFFDTAFAYRVGDRYQSMSNFQEALGSFEDGQGEMPLDLLEQYDILNKTVQSTDRKAQIAFLQDKYAKTAPVITKTLFQEMQPLQKQGANILLPRFNLNSFDPGNAPQIEQGDLLNRDAIDVCCLTRPHFEYSAAVFLAGFAVQMDMHIVAAAFSAPAKDMSQILAPLKWQTIAVVHESEDQLSKRSMSAIVDSVKSLLARQVAELARRASKKTTQGNSPRIIVHRVEHRKPVSSSEEAAERRSALRTVAVRAGEIVVEMERVQAQGSQLLRAYQTLFALSGSGRSGKLQAFLNKVKKTVEEVELLAEEPKLLASDQTSLRDATLDQINETQIRMEQRLARIRAIREDLEKEKSTIENRSESRRRNQISH